MKRIMLLSMFLLITCGFFSCKSQSTNKKSTAETTGDNSRNSLDWDGIYRGIMPCADCEGIQTTIVLSKDLTYKIKSKYLGKSDSVFERSGKFEWNALGSVITLADPDNKNKPINYVVGEGQLTQSDASGNKLGGPLPDSYILTKANYAILEKYWKLIELNGKPVVMDSGSGKEPHIILKEKDDRVIGNGGCNNISGNYRQGNMNRISFSKVITTQMACPNMEVESQFLNALTMADNYTIVGDVLVLNRARMAPLARFKTVYMK